MPKPVTIPANGDVEYTYEIVPTHFTEDKWIQMAEVHPSSPQYVHHAVIYIRPPDSNWLRHAPVGVPFIASTLSDPQDRLEAHGTTSDLLLVYAPGSSPDRWPDGMAKFVPGGSDLVFQIHYTTNGAAGNDQTSIGLVFAKSLPQQRVITLQLNDHAFIIPPGADDFRVEVQGTLPHDATLLSLFPHMHLRGKRFEYDIVQPDGSIETLLRVNYHFHWQLSYRLAEPRLLKAGTKLRAVAWMTTHAIIRIILIRRDGDLGRPDLSGDDGRILRCGGARENGQRTVFCSRKRLARPVAGWASLPPGPGHAGPSYFAI